MAKQNILIERLTIFPIWVANISTNFRKKIRNGTFGILRGLGEQIHEKTLSRKSGGTVPFNSYFLPLAPLSICMNMHYPDSLAQRFLPSLLKAKNNLQMVHTILPLVVPPPPPPTSSWRTTISAPPSTFFIAALKGQCHEIFCFCFFSWISFPQASDYNIRAVLNFFENSRRYSQLKVCHRCQRHRWQKLSSRKILIILFGHLWVVELTYIKIFAFKFTLSCQQPDIVAIICHRCHWYRWKFATGVIDTGGKFAAGIVDTGGKFATGINDASENGGKICHRCRWYRWQICHRRRWYRQQFCRRCRWHRWQICHRCRWYQWCTLTREFLSEFSKKFETV